VVEEGIDEAEELLRRWEDDGLEIDELRGSLASAENDAEKVTELTEEIGNLERGLDDARDRHDYEEALASREAALAALEDRRAEDLSAEVGHALSQWLREGVAERRRPEVLKRARELLASITLGRYELIMGEGEEANFRALDKETEEGKALEELSSGTRLQLLLAVRIAFVEVEEDGVKIPLLLDEVLANADEHRARAIIETAVALARDGRQLFYFTAQADELAKWREALEAADVEWTEVGLIGVAGTAAAFDWGGRSVDPATVPDPAGHDHSSYGRLLAVPPFDLWGEIPGGLHLWYLLDDPSVLRSLLAKGISSWGQLANFAERAGPGVDPVVRDAYEAAKGRAALAGSLAKARRVGRGRPVDRLALETSGGAVTDTYLDGVTELAQEVGGRAVDLLEIIEEREDERVKGFRSNKLDDLRDYFLEEGYLSGREPLSDDEILRRLTADVERLGVGMDVDELNAFVRRLAKGPGERR